MPPSMVVMVSVSHRADIPMIMEMALTVGNSTICDLNHAFKRENVGHESMNSGDETPDKRQGRLTRASRNFTRRIFIKARKLRGETAQITPMRIPYLFRLMIDEEGTHLCNNTLCTDQHIPIPHLAA